MKTYLSNEGFSDLDDDALLLLDGGVDWKKVAVVVFTAPYVVMFAPAVVSAVTVKAAHSDLQNIYNNTYNEIMSK